MPVAGSIGPYWPCPSERVASTSVGFTGGGPAVVPPSTVNTIPVTCAERSLARYRAALATSAGDPTRCNGCLRRTIRSWRSPAVGALLDLIGVAGIGLLERRRGTDLSYERFTGRGVDVGDDALGPLLHEELHDPATDAAGAAGDDRDLARKLLAYASMSSRPVSP